MMHQPGPMGMYRPQGPRGYGPVSIVGKRHAPKIFNNSFKKQITLQYLL
jgi:hypothetical protein